MSTPYHGDDNLDASFLAPRDSFPMRDASAPIVPPNAYLRRQRGYQPSPIEEAAPSPGMDPRVTYLRERSAEVGEVQYPLDEVRMTHSMAPVTSMPKYLGAEYLQNWETRIRAREGTRIKRLLRFWGIILFVCLCGTVVTSIVHKGLLAMGSGYWIISSGLGTLFLALGLFSAGRLYSYVRDYGFIPWLRLYLITVSRDADVREWANNYGETVRIESIRRDKDGN